MNKNPNDPKNLIADAYAMPELTAPEARSIFLDWALSVDDARAVLPALLAEYGARDHAMSAVLREGLADDAQPKRRGGRAGRRG